jgi:hypothetical protein
MTDARTDGGDDPSGGTGDDTAEGSGDWDAPDIVDVLPTDAIPSIDEPTFGQRFFGDSSDLVLVVDREGAPARAYPVRSLGHHEIVNDTVAGRPLAVTWCPICGSGAVYDRTVAGRSLAFGVSGKLADDALVMYDRETESDWQQSTGRCIGGPLAGRRLTALPAPLLTYERFREAYPDGAVLQPAGGESDAAARERYTMAPYDRYEQGEAFGLHGMRGTGEPREWDRDDLTPKTVVLGVTADGDAVGFPRPRVDEAGGVATAAVGDRKVVVLLADGELHAYAAPAFDLEPSEETGVYLGDGTRWQGATGRADDGRRLERRPATRLYAFAWQDAHGPDAFSG